LYGFWSDAGTFNSLLLANNLVAKKYKNNKKVEQARPLLM